MRLDNLGRVIITEQEAFDSLYNGKIKNFENVLVDGNIDIFNGSVDQNADPLPKLTSITNLPDIDTATFDLQNQHNWFMPEESKQFPLVHFLYSKCTDNEQILRVDKELELFIKHNMLDLLYYLKYLVDTMRANNIVWGVGRGSSVASYVLYLLGIHKIDSIKYNLDIYEFLKEK